ncbi:hypothetical protein B1F73_22065 [Pseudomonas syringae]|nr:hypothetical protein [Pseudomonas syringae pv. dysoxyli]PBP42422.1 hypothetical protein CCL14_07205 [Pseudomonas syringae]PBP46447.1 hypothetical protein CCL13_11740 [Pseudomonas syringae]RXT95335.1 hypothetical protein B1F73_22065 [Pseudomonas syringae]TFZ39018.1 hypothetical protein EWW49_07100 [Pseudomonas syringae]
MWRTHRLRATTVRNRSRVRIQNDEVAERLAVTPEVGVFIDSTYLLFCFCRACFSCFEKPSKREGFDSRQPENDSIGKYFPIQLILEFYSISFYSVTETTKPDAWQASGSLR